MIQQRVGWGHRVATWIATGFGIGSIPVAPGTFGTLLAIPLYLALRGSSPPIYAIVTLILFIAGAWLCHVAQEHLGRQDHPAIVWDEIVGYLIAAWNLPPGWLWIVVAFALFRLFDIWKPFPIRRLERWPGGLGVMADDALAGLYAWVVLHAIAWLAARAS